MFVGTRRNPVTVIILTIVTCGIYSYYWLYVTTKELNDALGEEKRIDPVLMLILSIVCGPIIYWWLYQRDLAMVELGQKEAVAYETKFILWLLLSLICGVGLFVSEHQTQTFLNELWDKRQGVAPTF